MRTAEPRNRELGLAEANSDELIEAMARYPELIQRPVVIWADRAVIARPRNFSCRCWKPAATRPRRDPRARARPPNR
jgi:arsenate reductase-like glutaredoxin family protein